MDPGVAIAGLLLTVLPLTFRLTRDTYQPFRVMLLIAAEYK